MGQLNEQQATDFLYKNIITKAVGTEPYVEPSVHSSEVVNGDIFLMCSDGLSDLVSKAEMEKILSKGLTVKEAAQNLVETAKSLGGHDNVTVVLAKVEEDHDSKDLPR